MINLPQLQLKNAPFGCLLLLAVVLPISKALTEITAVGLLLTTLAVFFRPHSIPAIFKKIRQPFYLFLLLFLIWAFIVSLFSLNPAASVVRLFSKWGEWIAVGVAASLVLNSQRRQKIFLFVLAGMSAVIAVDGLWQQGFGFDFIRFQPPLYEAYPTASFSYYIHYACYVSVLLMVSTAYSAGQAIVKKEKIYLLCHQVLLVIAVVLSFSRAAWLAVLVTGVLIAWMRDKKLFRWILAISIIVVLLAPTGILFRFRYMELPDWTGYRPESWRATLQMIQDHPWGIGINQYSSMIPHYFPKAGYAHNSFLQLTAETGIPGIIFFLGAIFYLIGQGAHKILKEPKTSSFTAAYLAGTAGFLMMAFFDNHLFNEQLAILFWLLAGALLASLKRDVFAPNT